MNTNEELNDAIQWIVGGLERGEISLPIDAGNYSPLDWALIYEATPARLRAQAWQLLPRPQLGAILAAMRDEVRRPAEVLSFLGIGNGMTVLDVYAAGGYYTFILSKAVGPDGTVYAQNTSRGLRFTTPFATMVSGTARDSSIKPVPVAGTVMKPARRFGVHAPPPNPARWWL